MNMVPHQASFSLPPDVPLILTFITALVTVIIILFCVIAACIITTFLIAIIISVICDRICWPCFERCERDIELGRISRLPTAATHGIIAYQALVPGNNLALEIYVHGLPNYDVEEMKASRQQDLEKLLPPPIVFVGSKETFSSCGDCSICLDEYEDGELCRVIPVCNHMFHLKCIGHWLKDHLTCPICRRCLLDV
ncbi:hypothetical protein LWI29_003038 [Acer saccharum]|uniref:RING-type E3 ubiquitin transferase n=1 Tax=Acer saccharum TaxID=4024 RepID=A0AA39SXE2_ACESA|nr:hypothetical protein LWI29_003038 [Acer saccharum]KAK1582428.1 hypothetical protein Q3G72_014848 [Acer saccharum]